MKKTLSTMAAAAVLMASTAIAPVFAQTSPAAPNTPAAPGAPVDPAAKPADSAATPAASTGTTAASSGSYLTEQAQNQISANDYIGKPVYNANNESIGDVNDLIFEDKGAIVAAVIGVGGFLGIGEKDVAVPVDRITMTREADNNNETRLTTTETAEALKAAPEFKTMEDQQAETDRTTTSSTMPATGGATNPSTAPAK
ncbi:PRC-barrel domain containing protein [Rhizobium deserti]|uniref:PRC-barrel domain containing protein n=1 Tax=Rhizobium deserti TaxID=2547961 RepID=A0A4R5UKQ7_9HYPH|nr:PRC-barrel domain-containing protein [Rhizobium deserti]TDK37502.1 PRC-barrel domain containing protein [Rhizobium deserti]